VFDLDPVYFLACHQPWSRLQVVIALHGKDFYQGGFQNRRRPVIHLVHSMPRPIFAAVFLLWPGGLKGNWAAVRVVARKKARCYYPCVTKILLSRSSNMQARLRLLQFVHGCWPEHLIFCLRHLEQLCFRSHVSCAQPTQSQKNIRIWGSFSDASVLIGCGHRCRSLLDNCSQVAKESKYMRRHANSAVVISSSAVNSKAILRSNPTGPAHCRCMRLSQCAGKVVVYRMR
jgi:hypothetical protein